MTTTKNMSTAAIAEALHNGDCLETTSRTEIERLEAAAANHGIETYTALERRDKVVYVIWAL